MMDVSWPPRGEASELLGRLALLIERGGLGRFFDGPVASSDERDFPDPWQPTAAAVERLLLRLLWLGHVDLDVAIDDLRRGDGGEGLLTRSAIEWFETRDGVGYFQIESIGNDNVAGALSHEIGRAFAAWLAATGPYREATPEPPTLRDGTIAAVYLGLGVVAANAAAYARKAGDLVGNTARLAHDVVVTGGLAPDEVLYLLAVQAVLRVEPIAAHATLRTGLRERLIELRHALTPHRSELIERLGLDLSRERPPLERDAAPPTVTDAERPEPDRRARLSGRRTYRLRRSQALVFGFLGMIVGFIGLGITHAVLDRYLPTWSLAGVVMSTLVLGVVGMLRTADYCALCSGKLFAPDTSCPGCGAVIAGRIKRPADYYRREIEHDD